MIEKELKIINKLGLHARAASLFVKTTEKYRCRVEMEKEGVRVNAKSIMGILMLAAPLGSIRRDCGVGAAARHRRQVRAAQDPAGRRWPRAPGDPGCCAYP